MNSTILARARTLSARLPIRAATGRRGSREGPVAAWGLRGRRQRCGPRRLVHGAQSRRPGPSCLPARVRPLLPPAGGHLGPDGPEDRGGSPRGLERARIRARAGPRRGSRRQDSWGCLDARGASGPLVRVPRGRRLQRLRHPAVRVPRLELDRCGGMPVGARRGLRRDRIRSPSSERRFPASREVSRPRCCSTVWTPPIWNSRRRSASRCRIPTPVNAGSTVSRCLQGAMPGPMAGVACPSFERQRARPRPSPPSGSETLARRVRGGELGTGYKSACHNFAWNTSRRMPI